MVHRLRGRPLHYDLSPYIDRFTRVRAREDEIQRLSDEALLHAAQALRAEAEGPEEAALCEAFALARDACRRAIGLRPFDIQVIGGMVLAEGRILEMETGEGKTLVAVLAAAYAALMGHRVHVLTFNDYLAGRDAAWMGPAYAALGLTARAIHGGMGPAARRDAYAADVTYVTAKEAGFDYLRDGLCSGAEGIVHRELDVVIVDEADSLLIDEARIPLVIAGDRDAQPHNATRLDALVRGLDPELHYAQDAEGRNVFLTDVGMDQVEQRLGCGPLEDPANMAWITEINLALHARTLLRRDVDYIVRDGAIELVDEFTGRVVKDRHWPDGLQAALEAKEGLRFRKEGMVLGSITVQHFVGLYAHLSGMTATARPDEGEFETFYGLEVTVLPPNTPCIRRDHPDRIFSHKEARDLAVVDEIVAAKAVGRPVLVGTASVRDSDALARRLDARGISCAVLNARTDAQEAALVAEAGVWGAVTISTNMAGRGTDIRLGGTDEGDRARVAKLGGLLVIGMNRHESRRIDQQLRGRAGRQGDPGASRFFISLEDDLIVRYSVDQVLPRRSREPRDEALTDPIVAHRVDWAQRVIAAQNAEIRRTLWRYAGLVEKQRALVRGLRDEALQEAGPLARFARLSVLDRLWSDHLAYVDEIREGIYLARFAGQDPLDGYLRDVDTRFRAEIEGLDAEIEDATSRLTLGDGGEVEAPPELRGPSSTWTYLVDDDPFRQALGLHVAASMTLGIGAALHAPLYIPIALYRRFRRR